MSHEHEGLSQHENLVGALRRQELVQDNEELARLLSQEVVVISTKEGAEILRQGASGTNNMFFVLAGELSILVNERVVASRVRGQHVGEMALIDIGAPRAATVIAHVDSVLARIERDSFLGIANAHPEIWQRLSRELAKRLRERNSRERNRNEIPKVFVGSSSEGKRTLGRVEEFFSDKDVQLEPWTLSTVFSPSEHTMESLEREVATCDFAILIFTPDDWSWIRSRLRRTARDNVLFELGLFMGGLGRARSFILQPSNRKLHMPSDLLGLTTLRYIDEDEIIRRCDEIYNVIEDLKPI